jgi:phage protein D
MINLPISLVSQTPIFSLKADGVAFYSDRVLRIEVTDAAGLESDELTITLDDSFPQISRPREGAVFTVSLGFLEWGPPILVGSYVLEEIERNGFERTLTLVAKAADHAQSLKEPKTRSFEGKTFGKIADQIAGEHSLKLAIADKFQSHSIPYAAQTEESDQHFLTRIGKQIGAVIAPKDGHLLVTERRSGKAASGNPLPTIFVTPTRLISNNAYFVRIKPRSRFSKVVARWQDRSAGQTKSVTIKAGEKGPSMTIREVFQSEAAAQRAAEAKVTELKSGEGEMSVEMIGEPKACAEAPIQVLGVAPDIDGDWIASTVTHVWDYSTGGSAVTTIEAEFGMEEKDDKSDDKKKNSGKSSPQTKGEYVSVLDR